MILTTSVVRFVGGVVIKSDCAEFMCGSSTHGKLYVVTSRRQSALSVSVRSKKSYSHGSPQALFSRFANEMPGILCAHSRMKKGKLRSGPARMESVL
jgi:hypothetical protein